MLFTAEELERSIEKGVAWLKRRQLDCGGWGSCDASQTGLTGLVILALREAGVSTDDMSIIQAVKFIVSKQRQDGFLQWTSPTQPGSYYGTARALMGILVGSYRELLEANRKVVEKAITALMDHELPCGGWEANPGAGLTAWASAEVLFSIFLSGNMYVEEIWRAPMHYYVRMRKWFAKTQSLNGSWDNNCLDCTARVLFFLSSYGYRGAELWSAVNFILGFQREDRIGDSPWATGWALLGLMAFAGAKDPTISSIVERGIFTLMEAQLEDGGWPVFYDSDVSFETVTAVAVWALAYYRNIRRGLRSVLA